LENRAWLGNKFRIQAAGEEIAGFRRKIERSEANAVGTRKLPGLEKSRHYFLGE
jgi:hypothetical protein